MNPAHLSATTNPSTLPNQEWSATTLRTMAARYGVVPWMFAPGTAEMRELTQAG